MIASTPVESLGIGPSGCGPDVLAVAGLDAAGMEMIPLRNFAGLATPSRPPVKRTFVAPGPKLGEVLETRWKSYRNEFKRCLTHCSEEAVHELRVAIRRLLAQLLLVEEVRPGSASTKLRKALKRRFKELGELRDIHVQREIIRRLLRGYPALVMVDAELKRHQKRIVKQASRTLESAREKKLLNWIVRVHRSLLQGADESPTQHRLLGQIMQATSAAFAEVNQRRLEAIVSDPSTIHHVRIAYKKFRYMVEALSPTWTGYSRKQLRRMAHYQRRLGRIQDLEVFRKLLQEFAERHPPFREVLQPVVKLVDRRRRDAIRAFMRKADELQGFWPPPA